MHPGFPGIAQKKPHIATHIPRGKCVALVKLEAPPSPPGIVSNHKQHPNVPPQFAKLSELYQTVEWGLYQKLHLSPTEYSKRQPPQDPFPGTPLRP